MTGAERIERRDILTGIALLSLGYVGLVYEPSQSGGGSLIVEVEGLDGRSEQLRPVPGGARITTEDLDGYGTLAGGVTGPDGQPAAVTCRHVVDPQYPDSDESDVIGTPVYQPDLDSDPIGTVVDVGPSKGIDSTDWALIEIESEWTSHVLGLGSPAARGQPEIGDRIVTSGVTTGLLGAEITDVGISQNWRGTLIDNLVEYRVDENLDTAGNSGSWVGTLDPETGAFQPLGIHAFRIEDRRYAIPLEQVLDDSGSSLSSDGTLPDPPTADPFVEGAIEDLGSTVAAVVANIGGETVQGREIRLRDDSGTTVDSATVDLEPLEHSVLSLEAADVDRPTLETGDVEIEAGH